MLESSRLDNYNDLASLQRLKVNKPGKEEQNVKAVAQQFESLFVSMMLKSMRAANKGFSEGNMLSSKDSEFYQEMFDSQLAVSLSSGRGIGLADVIEKQLMERRNLKPENRNEPLALASMDAYQRKDFSHLRRSQNIQEAMAEIEHIIQHAPETNAQSALKAAVELTTSEEPDIDFSSPESFIRSLYPMAKKIEAESGIDARLMLAQSALETGWGQHEIRHQDGSPSRNLFGIKAQSDWSGGRTEILTTEYREGVAIKVRDNFRSYDSYLASFRDYANFLQTNERYQAALDKRDDPMAFSEALQNSGYATDPAYANKLQSIMGKHLSDLPELFSGGTEARQ
jgi:flagellar protein FlgJ